jgi:hypothetical protein
MKTRHLALLAATLLAGAGVWALAGRPEPAPLPQPQPAGTAAVRIVFGETQSATRVYDGSLSVSSGSVIRLEPYRFFQNDAIAGADSWKLTLKRVAFESRSGRPNSVAGGGPAMNVVPAGITATLAAPETARVSVRTTQGNFEFVLGELRHGSPRTFLEGDVVAERVPPVTRVADSADAQQDYPSLLETRAGDLWYAWQAYRERGDSIFVRKRSASGWSQPERLTDGKGDFLGTALAEDDGRKVHLVWCERTGEDWNLVERVHDGKSWSAKTAITSGAGTHIHHRLASDARGALHLVWVAHRAGKSYAAYARFAAGRWSAPQDVSGPGAWAPDVAADREGSAWVAWDSYRSGNYDIFARKLPASGDPGAIQQVTKSPRFQSHPSLAVDSAGRPWLAWDTSGVNWGKDWTHDSPYRATVLYADRQLHVAVLDGGDWKQPKADPNVSLPVHLRRYAQLPRLRFDPAGHLWLMFQSRTSVMNNREDYWAAGGRWDTFVTSLGGVTGAWTPALMLPQSTCRVEAPYELAPARAGGMLFAWPTDNRPFMAAGFGAVTAAGYDVYLGALPAAGPGSEPQLETLADPAPPAPPVAAHANENADVERIRAYRIRPGGRELRILRGDFHRHTDISNDGSGDGSVEDYYRYMIDAAQMDTGIISDHNMGGDVEYSWWRTEKSYDVYRIRDGFTPLFGYERSVSYPNGHRNVVFDHRGVRTLPISPEENQAKVNSGPILYPYLRQNRGICMEHSLATGQGTDWRDNDPELEPLVELYQGYHANYEYAGAPLAESDNYLVSIHGGYRPAGFFWNALAKGLKLGVQASSDHVSTHTSYAMIYTPSARREDIVQAMRDRHAYAATDNIVLDVTASDGERTYMMGDILEARGRTVRFTIRTAATDAIDRIDLIKNNTIAFTRSGSGKQMTLDYTDAAPRPGENYYYVRVVQVDRNLAWSSPIWVKY